MGTELHVKRLQLLKEAFPKISRVAVLWNPDTQWQAHQVEYLKSVAPTLAIELNVIDARTFVEFSRAFEDINREHAQGLLVIGGSPFWNHRSTLVKLAGKAKLPTMYYAREFADAGGLMSYGANYADLYRRAAGYVDKILKGAKPGDLPIEQPTKFELVVNLKTAKALGITIPESILLRADEVIR
jgi:putative ABC transport system substrate-binding protein